MAIPSLTPHSSRLPSEVASDETKMLQDAKFREEMIPTFRLIRSSRFARRLARLLLVAMAITVMLMCFAPWRQTVNGTGSVFAYDPTNRPQPIESPLPYARVARLGDGIAENVLVHKGDLIAELVDVDETYSTQLDNKLEATKQAYDAAVSQMESAKAAVISQQRYIESINQTIKAYELARQNIQEAGDAMVAMAKNKITANEQALLVEKANLAQASVDYAAFKELYEKNFSAKLKFQEVKTKYESAMAKVQKAETEIDSATNDLENKSKKRDADVTKAQAEINNAIAKRDKAINELDKAQLDVAKSQESVAKAQEKVTQAQVDVNRQASRFVYAPFDGYVVQIIPNLMTKLLKQGEQICTIVPNTKDRAVQIWLNGNDAPLVEEGRHVRLQFEGWPAIQFSGWPSVAVGTFGGEVVSVDAMDNGKQQYRVIIRPAHDDIGWPDENYLRQGVRVNGWVLLNRVPLWYEVWRRLNAFPPVVSSDEPKSKPNSPKFLK